jgi:hypothetical protein
MHYSVGCKASQAIGTYPHGKTLSKTDTWGEDGSASSSDTERISTSDAIVEKVRSRRRWTTAKIEIVLDLTCRTAVKIRDRLKVVSIVSMCGMLCTALIPQSSSWL